MFTGGASPLITLGQHAGVMIASLLAVAVGLGVMVVAELNWQRALNSATAAGLVARPTGEVTSVP
jgi:hypothetical protein